jgi:hypothetical protein
MGSLPAGKAAGAGSGTEIEGGVVGVVSATAESAATGFCGGAWVVGTAIHCQWLKTLEQLGTTCRP